MVLDLGENCMEQANGGGLAKNVSEMLEPEPSTEKPKPVRARTSSITQRDKSTHNGPHAQPCATWDGGSQVQRRLHKTEGRSKGETAQPGEPSKQPPCRRPLSLEIKPQRIRATQPVRKVIQPPWRSGGPSPPTRSLTSLSLGPGNWLRRSESTCTVNSTMPPRAARGQMRPATSLPHIARGVAPLPSPSTPAWPVPACGSSSNKSGTGASDLFQSNYQYEPQFEYTSPEPISVLEKYREGSGLFLSQAVGIMECVLRKYETYENFEEVTGGNLLPKSQVWAATRKYLQKEGCVGEVVVSLSDELLSQAVMMVERCRPTLTINLSGARQHWLEGMLRHEIGCFSKDQVYLDGILRILRHRRNIDFKILTALGKVSYEDVERLRHLAVLKGTRIPHFMQDDERYLHHLDHIVTVNELNDAELQELIP